MPEPFFDLAVPPQVRDAFQAFIEFDDQTHDRLTKAIAESSSYVQVGDLQQQFREALPDDHLNDADRLVTGLMSLRGQLREREPDEIAEALSRSASFDLDEDQRASLRDRVLPLLSAPAIASTANAIELLTRQSRNYRTARVLTDIRPVFAEHVDEAPTGAVIVQTLQVDTWDRQGSAETIYIALDEVDLKGLKEVVDRAVTKADSIRSVLDSTDLTLFELDEDSRT